MSESETPGAPETVEVDGIQELDSLGRATGVEIEVSDEILVTDEVTKPGDIEQIQEPFDPNKIDVITRNTTVELLLSRIRDGRIDLEPEFQRHRGIWSTRAKSRLIESLLLRIPLPTLYAAEVEDAEESWAVVDGIQRLTAISEFIEPHSIGAQPLTLRDLEYLKQYEGALFTDLPGRLRTRLREAELVIHLIRRGTPEPVKFNIFARINTGGTPLSPQELRHALIAGPARHNLQKWAESDLFRQATSNSIRSERMADREMVLRFVAFYLTDPDQYLAPDFDSFLRTAMRELNRLSRQQVTALEATFFSALATSIFVFNRYAFRKRTPSLPTKRNPINKALFEVITVNLAKLSPQEQARAIKNGEQVQHLFLELMHDDYFLSSISVGTGQIARVRYRFRRVEEILKEALT